MARTPPAGPLVHLPDAPSVRLPPGPPVRLPDNPALVAGVRGAVWLSPDGEIETLALDQAARRLGAVVSATDVRPAAKEQVESLGAKFVAVEDEEFKEAETSGGYAKEMSDEYKAKQAALIAETVPSKT